MVQQNLKQKNDKIVIDVIDQGGHCSIKADKQGDRSIKISSILKKKLLTDKKCRSNVFLSSFLHQQFFSDCALENANKLRTIQSLSMTESTFVASSTR